jgi:hypothetical protein
MTDRTERTNGRETDLERESGGNDSEWEGVRKKMKQREK